MRDHIAEYGGDPDLICVTGGSAGAHLATMLALTPNEPAYQPGFETTDTSVAACIPFYAPYNLTTLFASTGAAAWIGQRFARWVVGTTPEEAPESFDAASPMHHLTPDAPPFFVIHGSADNLVPVVPGARVRPRVARGLTRAGAVRRGARCVARVRRVPLDAHHQRRARGRSLLRVDRDSPPLPCGR